MRRFTWSGEDSAYLIKVRLQSATKKDVGGKGRKRRRSWDRAQSREPWSRGWTVTGRTVMGDDGHGMDGRRMDGHGGNFNGGRGN
jgi:hypothetical protein